MKPLAIVFMFLLMLSLSQAQTSEYQFPQGFTRVTGNTITYCVSLETPLAELDEDIARLIARSVGANAKFYYYDRYGSSTSSRVMSMQRQEFAILLTDHCDVFMGMPRSINASFDYPADEQQLSTRPYMQVSFVLVSKNHAIKSIRDIPQGGSLLFEHASLPSMLISKVRPDIERLHAVATVGSEALFDRFERPDAEVMIAWGPSFFQRYAELPEGWTVNSIKDLPNMDWLVVGGISRERTALRTQIDTAILKLIEDGRMQELLNDYELPQTFFSPGPTSYQSVEGDDDDDDDEELEGIDFSSYGYDVEDEFSTEPEETTPNTP
ncbi:MAG: hypothetical protein R2880_19820 [Deinococcales bacterium]